MPTSLTVLALVAFSVGVCLLAFVKGGSAERIAAAVIAANLLAGIADSAWLHSQTFTFAADGLTALVLLPLALRHVSVWLGLIMILYALQFALEAAYTVQARASDLTHAVLNNLDFAAINLCLLGATVVRWRRRRKAPAT